MRCLLEAEEVLEKASGLLAGSRGLPRPLDRAIVAQQLAGLRRGEPHEQRPPGKVGQRRWGLRGAGCGPDAVGRALQLSLARSEE
eukprot:CAMPEP_0176102768 /NCGR_PEP_ID=MMETSP0120_2-20121206/51554_1 /TAXON_ID=160619 /ORGANISM="Kryptoperidinium foliaceum, Strain CCMP 1326" /LENGTH=84 /DNA_ID=CAMNT_0017436841 /DNA_START=14 /DNA_END=265 /DNA_ORIENTATION=+